MSDFEEDLSNVMGSFISMELDYIEKSSNELEEVTKERDLYKEVIEEVREWLKYKAETLDEFDIPKRKETGAFWFSTRGEIDNLLQILDKVKGE